MEILQFHSFSVLEQAIEIQLDHDFIVITLPTTSSNTSIILSSKINASLIELDAGLVILLLELGKPIRVT